MIGGKAVRARFFYGWVIVAAGTVLMTTQCIIVNSFGVFFKPLAADFGWDRATTSGVQSFLFITLGLFCVTAGWLADRFGTTRVLAFCGCLAGLGLVLTSRVTALWQIYLTYSVMTAIGLSGTFPIAGAVTARWFVERRGLALGIVTSGVGLGNVIGPPTVARLIEAFGWSRAYFILGVAASAIIVGAASLLRDSPEKVGLRPYGMTAKPVEPKPRPGGKAEGSKTGSGLALAAVVRSKTLWLLFGIFFLFTFCNQLVTVHLVNLATDMGIVPFIAATLISVVGVAGAAGRLLMGGASDRIGNINTVIISAVGVALSLTWLIFAGNLWMLYLFAAVYGFTYGAEIPQQTALIGKYFDLRAVLVGITHAAAYMGGALGSWAGGIVFDLTRSYQIAFLIGIGAIVCALAGTLVLGRRK